jgi:hypothetical protein
MYKGFLIIIITLLFNGLYNNIFAQKNFAQPRSADAAGMPTVPQAIRVSQGAAIPPSFYADRLGLVCKQEWKLEKSSGIAFRFRLGSLDYVNRLEGKNQ